MRLVVFGRLSLVALVSMDDYKYADADQKSCFWSESASRERFEEIQNWVSMRPALKWLGKCDKNSRDRRDWVLSCPSTRSPPQLSNSAFTASLCIRLRKLGGRGVLFVGDSLSRLHAISLAAITNSTSTTGNLPLTPKSTHAESWRIPCDSGESIKLAWLRNDWLSLSPPDQASCAGVTFCEAWAIPDLLKSFDVIVLNSGAHMLGRNESDYARHTELAASFVSDHARVGARLLFRDTVPGHSDCDKFIASNPFLNVNDAEDYISAHPFYDGARFKALNDIARDSYQKHGLRPLEVYNATVMRIDAHIGHGDCLHYCVPGPSVYWCDVLLDALA